jgi:hypothetical protein
MKSTSWFWSLLGLLVGCFTTLIWQEGVSAPLKEGVLESPGADTAGLHFSGSVQEKEPAGGLPCPLSEESHVTWSTACRLIHLSWPTAEDLAGLRQEPRQIATLYARYRSQLRQDLGPAFESLEDTELRYIFCTLTAHAWAPCGPSTECRWPQLLQAPTLNCGNYGLLAVYLAGCFGGRRKALPVRFVGWEGPTAGNHQMLFAEEPERGCHLLLDPMTGLIGRVGFDAVASGRPVAGSQLVAFCYRRDEAVAAFRNRLIAALCRGQFRPSELLYYFDGLDSLINHYGDPCWWPTPACRYWRQRQAAASPAATRSVPPGPARVAAAVPATPEH